MLAKNILNSGNGAQTAGQNLIWQAQTGNLTVNGKLKAGRYLTLTADKGKIVTTVQGELTAGDALNVTTGDGDINLNADAAAGSKDGSITIYKIDVENVQIAVKDHQNNMSIGQITVGKGLFVTGDKIDISNVQQRQGYDNILLLAPRASDGGPMDYLNIDNINPNLGLEIDQLWAHIANLHVNNQRFYLDKLSILDLANLSNIETTTQVWGSAPVRNTVNTSYWYNPSNRHPWMNLYFTERPHTQLSNGLLLRYDDYYYVYNQRDSAVNTQFENLAQETSLRQVRQYGKRENPGYTYGMYERFDLLDFSPNLLDETDQSQAQITIQ